MSELDPEKIYEELTDQILEICTSEERGWSDDKFYCLPNQALSIAVDINEKIGRYFRIWNMAESEREQAKAFLRRSLPHVYLWIEIGREIGREMLKEAPNKEAIMELYSDARFLRLYEDRHLDNDDFRQNAVVAYFLLALVLISRFFIMVERGMVPRNESGDIAFTNVQYETFIEALGALTIAQEAFNYGTRRYEIETGERLATEVGGSWAQAKSKIDAVNQKTEKEAYKKWKPLVEEVKQTMDSRAGLSQSSACAIVTRRHNESASDDEIKRLAESLRTRLKKYW